MQLTFGLFAMLHLLLHGMRAPPEWDCCCRCPCCAWHAWGWLRALHCAHPLTVAPSVALPWQYRAWIRHDYGRNPFQDQEELQRLLAQQEQGGSRGTPALLPQHPPTHCPAAGANGWTDKQQLLPERRCPCALQNVTATLPSTCGVQLQWGKGWGRTTQLRSCRGCSAAASHPPAPLYGKNQLLLRIRGAEPRCTLKPFSGSPREDAILYSSISKNSLSGNFWVLEPASGTKPVLSCQGMGGG